MEAKKAYLLIGQILGLRTAIIELEKQQTQIKSQREPFRDYYDEGFFDQQVAARKAQEQEIKESLMTVGKKYGDFKCWFKHNVPDYKEELQAELSTLENALIRGNNKENLSNLINSLDTLLSAFQESETQMKQRDDYILAMKKEETKVISQTYFNKELKKSLFQNNPAIFSKLNAYLKANQIKAIDYSTLPKKPKDIVISLTLLQNKLKTLRDNLSE